jgi:hypothetical protein
MWSYLYTLGRRSDTPAQKPESQQLDRARVRGKNALAEIERRFR